ncbi:glycerol channel [Sparganum proliferum]
MARNQSSTTATISPDPQPSLDTDNIKEERLPSVNPINEIPQWSKAQAWQLVRQCVAEMLGTGLVSFAAVRMAEINSASIPAAVVVSSSLALGIWLAGPVSGGHVNPSVTLALILCRIVSCIYLPIYWAAQYAGAFAGAALAHAFLDGSAGSSDPPTGSGTALGSTPLQVLSEYLASSIFILIVLVSADSRRPDAWSGAGFNTSLAIGLIAMVNTAAFGAQYPCGFNPAVFLAPSVIRGKYVDVLIHTFVPFLGSITAALLFQLILCPDAGQRRTVKFFTSRRFQHHRDYRFHSDTDAAP